MFFPLKVNNKDTEKRMLYWEKGWSQRCTEDFMFKCGDGYLSPEEVFVKDLKHTSAGSYLAFSFPLVSLKFNEYNRN